MNALTPPFSNDQNGPTGALSVLNGCIVDQRPRQTWRRGAFSDCKQAANLLLHKDEKASLALGCCRWAAYEEQVGLHRNTGSGLASFSGLQTCKKVWLCPVCSAVISRDRQAEMNTLLAWSRSKGHRVVMLTLTARHAHSDDLALLLDRLKKAKQLFRQRREWRSLPLIGSVTATEVTHGGNGWHPHFHEILILSDDVDLLALLPVWLKCLGANDLDGNEYALDVSDSSAVGEYVAKWGAAEELTLGRAKKAGKGKTPWQVLSESRKCNKAADAWIEYAMAFRGRNQLFWSRGLKDLCGLNDPVESDDEAGELELLGQWLASGLWKDARKRRASLLDAAENGTSVQLAEIGLTDGEIELAELYEVIE